MANFLFQRALGSRALHLNMVALIRRLSDGVIRCPLYPAGIIIIYPYAKELFDVEVSIEAAHQWQLNAIKQTVIIKCVGNLV